MTPRYRHPTPRTAFLTFSCHQRRHLLTSDRVRAVLRDQLAHDVDAEDIELHAWVIMSNHMHLLATSHRLAVSHWLAAFKQRTAFTIRKDRDGPANRDAFWMRGGGYDRTIWSWQEYWHKLEYTHLNAVRAEICSRPTDYPWSSASDLLLRPRAGFPRLAPPPEGLLDLLWWKPTA